MRKILSVIGMALMGLFALAVPAFATPQTDAVTGAAATLKDDMLAVGTAVLPYAAAVLILVIGWRFAKKFVRG
jgi:hypothetical protein